MGAPRVPSIVLIVLLTFSASVGCTQRDEPPELTAAQIEEHRARVRAAAAVDAPRPTPSPVLEMPTPPKVPRLIESKIKLPPQVYLEPSRMLAHHPKCAVVTSKMVHTSVAAASMQRYRIHDGCAHLPADPDSGYEQRRILIGLHTRDASIKSKWHSRAQRQAIARRAIRCPPT